MSKDNKTKSIPLSFSALNPYVEEWKTELVEKEITGQNFIYYGKDNHFPDYLLDLYRNVATLKTIIDTYKCYICGNKIISNVIQLSNDEMEFLASSGIQFQLVSAKDNLKIDDLFRTAGREFLKKKQCSKYIINII